MGPDTAVPPLKQNQLDPGPASCLDMEGPGAPAQRGLPRLVSSAVWTWGRGWEGGACVSTCLTEGNLRRLLLCSCQSESTSLRPQAPEGRAGLRGTAPSLPRCPQAPAMWIYSTCYLQAPVKLALSGEGKAVGPVKRRTTPHVRSSDPQRGTRSDAHRVTGGRTCRWTPGGRHGSSGPGLRPRALRSATCDTAFPGDFHVG